MAEEILKQELEVEDTAGAEIETEVEENEEQKPSFEDLLADKDYQAEFDRRVTKALNTAKSKWQSEQEKASNEAKKLEKMTEQERANYQFAKDKEAFEAEKKAFAKSQLKLATGKELINRGLSADFADFLTADTAEETKARIDEFEAMFNKSVSETTKTQMRGAVPKAPKNNTKEKDSFLDGFTKKG